MGEAPPQSLDEAWEAAIPLDEAWIELSRDGFDRFKWRALNRGPDPDGDVFSRKLGDWLPVTREGRQAKLYLTEHMEKSYLFDRLYRGELVGIGFRLRPNRTNAAERVPRDLFFRDPEGNEANEAHIHWTKGQVEFDNEAFFDVRIVAPSEELPREKPLSEADKVVGDTTQRRGGRPNQRSIFHRAAKDAWEADCAFRGLPNRTAQARELKARIYGEDARMDDNRTGCSLDSVKRWIGEALSSTNSRPA